MKKIMVVFAGLIFLVGCTNNPGESGTVNDGFKGGADPNGAVNDSAGLNTDPSLDTAIGDDRVDTEKRDSTQNNQ